MWGSAHLAQNPASTGDGTLRPYIFCAPSFSAIVTVDRQRAESALSVSYAPHDSHEHLNERAEAAAAPPHSLKYLSTSETQRSQQTARPELPSQYAQHAPDLARQHLCHMLAQTARPSIEEALLPALEHIDRMNSGIEMTPDGLTYSETRRFEPGMPPKSLLFHCITPSQHLWQAGLLMKNVSCLYEALGLGKHRQSGPDLQSSLLTYDCPKADASERTWLKDLLAACIEYKQMAFRAAKEDRFLGGVREEFGPTPHVLYIVCPSSQPEELHTGLIDAALLLRECATTVNVAPGVSIGAPESDSAAESPDAIAARTTGETAPPDAGAEVDEKDVQHSDYIQIKGIAKSSSVTKQGPRLQLLTVQVISQLMLMDITGHAAKFLALSSYSRQLHTSG